MNFRIVRNAFVLVALLITSSTAQAGHRHGSWGCGYHHHHGGWGGSYYGGYRNYGYGGYGLYGYRGVGYYGSGISLSIGGGYSPYYGSYYGGGFYNPSAFYYSTGYAPRWSSFNYYPSYSYPTYCYPSYYGGYPAYYGGYPVYYGASTSRIPLGLASTVSVARPTVVAAAPSPKVVEFRASTDAAKMSRLLVAGDTAFKAGRFSDALGRYREAELAYPEHAAPYLHKGFAYIAQGQYRLATTAFRKSYKLDGRVDRTGFTLDTLYGGKETMKSIHLDRLAEEAMRHGDEADGYYLLGIMLYYNGEMDRSQKFFAKAAEFAGRDDLHIAYFLRSPRTAPEVHVAERPLRLVDGDGT